jgi:hypothetical protein
MHDKHERGYREASGVLIVRPERTGSGYRCLTALDELPRGLAVA